MWHGVWHLGVLRVRSNRRKREDDVQQGAGGAALAGGHHRGRVGQARRLCQR